MERRTPASAAIVAVSTLALALVTSTATVGCDEDRPTCYAGDYRSCACADGARGFAACAAGGEYGGCVCDGRVPGLDASAADAGSPSDASAAEAEAAAKKPFLAACGANDECETGLCQTFPAKGMFCSKPCTAATAAVDCPAPSPGCNNNGVCKTP